MTNEQKENISKSMIKCHAEGRHPGWSKQNLLKRSIPEIHFNKILNENGLFNIYTIKEQLKIGKYFLDFAFIELKVNLEIDGIQHIRIEKAILHDKIRNEFLESKGWKIYRIFWKTYYDNSQIEYDKFISWLKKIDENQSYYYPIIDCKESKNIPKYGTRFDYFKNKKLEYKITQKESILSIEKSDIDFSKFGWVKQVSKLINKKSQKISKWMKIFMPDFYQEKCFKR